MNSQNNPFPVMIRFHGFVGVGCDADNEDNDVQLNERVNDQGRPGKIGPEFFRSTTGNL